MVTSRWLSGSLFSTALACMTLLLPLHHLHVVVEAIEALCPKPLVVAEPPRSLRHRRGVEVHGAELGTAAARDEAGAFQNLQMLGNGRLAEAERLDQLVDRGFA